MQYPIFLSPAEAAEVLRIGKTSLYARIKDGSLKTAKMGRSTRITFSSVIEYALRCLREGNGAAEFPEDFRGENGVPSWAMAEHLARQLCNTHSSLEDDLVDHPSATDSKGLLPDLGKFAKSFPEGEL